MRKPPHGFELLNDKLDEFEASMREAVYEPHEGKRKIEATWAIARVNWERTRFVFQAFRRGVVSKAVFEYCADSKLIDGSLATKWMLKGYERLCCVQCVHRNNHSFGGSCVCRVPIKDRMQREGVQCCTCGCHGCASGDGEGNPWHQLPQQQQQLEREEEVPQSLGDDTQ